MWQNSANSSSKDGSFLIADSDDEAMFTARRDVVIDSSDNDEVPEDFHSSSMIQTKVRNILKKNRLIYSDEESISDVDSNNRTADGESESEELSDDNNKSRPFVNDKNAKRKDISRDYTKENIKGLKIDSSSDSMMNFSDSDRKNESGDKEDLIKQNEDVTDEEGNDIARNENDKSVIYINSSDSDCNPENKENEEILAMSFAKQEIGVGNVDPLVAQKRGFLSCKLLQLQNQLQKTKLLLNSANIDMLPDKGKKLQDSIIAQVKEIRELEAELEKTPLTQSFQKTSTEPTYGGIPNVASPPLEKETRYIHSDSEYLHPSPTEALNSKELGKKAQETRDRELSLTIERLQDLHHSLVSRPAENEEAEDPRGLKVTLMPHQRHALAWLMWREQQRPSGGLLADDMGLGKTLTMISLIMATRDQDNDSDDEEWGSKKKPILHKGGTLVVCPASLLSQWEGEIRSKCKKGILSVEVYHGTNREKVPRRLASNDVVITTYNLLAREFNTMSMVYKIRWKRVILDEAHAIRNHKSKIAEAASRLVALKRWALTGTPIQNKEMDMYSILKFLDCSPFNDLRVWKRWVENKSAAGHQRLATVMKTLMLRRTKQELQANGALQSLPSKNIEEVIVKLDTEEQLVYEKVLIFSRTFFAQFLAQKAEKDHVDDLFSGIYDKPSFLSNPNKNTQFTKAQNKLLAVKADVKSYEILVLLLRLRQVCCHPALIHAMLDQSDLEQSELMVEENLDPDIVSRVNNMSICENEDSKEDEIGVDQRVTKNLLTIKNPVFDSGRISSKVRAVLDLVSNILSKGDKLIIVSQWMSMLKIIASFLTTIKGATFLEFSGSVAVKERQGIMDSFNDVSKDPKILLLSLTAGGVGLNLVGGNHLLLIDIHWNPQLETQAQDRIYRFGQKKDVFIYKFICKDTIEERIKNLQDRKLQISKNVLSGENVQMVSKLTLNDLKSLFAL